VCFAGLILLSLVGTAARISSAVQDAATPLASCNASFTVCLIPENISLHLPFTAFAGDVILTDPNSSAVSHVFGSLTISLTLVII